MFDMLAFLAMLVLIIEIAVKLIPWIVGALIVLLIIGLIVGRGETG